MQIEYEATFANIDKNEIRAKLQSVGAQLIKPEFLQTRVNFDLPESSNVKGGWMRIRNEGDKITLSLKAISSNNAIEDQKEICLEVDSFEKAEALLDAIGCKRKAYQETMREIWHFNGVEICIDEWPHLEPFVEIEGKSKEVVENMSHKLGFDYSKAIFGAVDQQYKTKYGVDEYVTNSVINKLVFEGENPFLKFAK